MVAQVSSCADHVGDTHFSNPMLHVLLSLYCPVHTLTHTPFEIYVRHASKVKNGFECVDLSSFTCVSTHLTPSGWCSVLP